MKLLHICSNFIGNKLYIELFQKLSSYNITQSIYVPIKDPKYIGLNSFNNPKVDIIYDPILKPFHRLMYFRKINAQLNSIISKDINIEGYDCIHAHTLFSDGGTAYLLHKKYGTPYIVSIRNTDINFFFRYYKHLKRFIHKVLTHASKVIFISHAYVKKLKKILSASFFKKIEHKIMVIPNGISGEYFSKANPHILDDTSIKLITVASLDKNKNTITLLRTIKRLRSEGIPVSLDIVGNGPHKPFLEKYSEKNNLSAFVNFHGRLDSHTIINYLDKSDIFVLLSFRETFGVSYIEAMARGLPIIYTKDEGIDGYFKQGEVGYATNPLNIDNVVKCIKDIKHNYEDISWRSYKNSSNFDWQSISDIYRHTYIATIL